VVGVRRGVVVVIACLLAIGGAAECPYELLSGTIAVYPEVFPNHGPQNYIQHPRATLLPDGGVVVTSNTGHCCYSARQAWEGVFALWYEPGGGVPLWQPIYGTNDYGRSWAGQHEMGFVDAAYMCDRWVVAGIGTLDGTSDLSNRASVWVLEMKDITSGILSSPWRRWFCSEAGCEPFAHPDTGMCIGSGFGTSFVRFRGRWYVYYSDDCAAVKTHYRREIVNPCDLALGPAERIYWIGGAFEGVGGFSLGRDGRIYALADMADRRGLVEWWSGDGVWFVKTGRKWDAAGVGGLWDGSYLKTPSGTIVEPRVIVATEDDLNDIWQFAPANVWRIRWIADSPAALPSGWFQAPESLRTRIERRTGTVRRRLETGG